jgi:iron complex transport system substrate-binding protein
MVPDVGMGAPAPRVVSLLPSATEIVAALGAGDELVGISHECDFPPSIRGLPVLTRARIEALGSSRSIDAEVRRVARDGLSIYLVDETTLAELAPDVIITQDLCEVCAVSLDDVKSAVARLTHSAAVQIVSLRPTRLSDIFEDIGRVAVVLGRVAEGSALRARLEARVDQIAARARSSGARPKVVSIEWIEPLMLGGTWMPELIELAGGVPMGARAGEAAPTVDRSRIAELRPDVIVIKPCGFGLERTLAEIEGSGLRLGGPHTRVYATDGNAFFNRPGPRIVESLEIMAACVHPDLFADLAEKHRSVVRALAR